MRPTPLIPEADTAVVQKSRFLHHRHRRGFQMAFMMPKSGAIV
jgi:hypothetical protein